MRLAGLVVAAILIAKLAIQPAAACTVSSPYRPLTARPAGTRAVLLVDVVALDLRRYPAVAQIRVVRDGRGRPHDAQVFSLPYWRSICGGERDPAKGERLVAYVGVDRVLGWATQAEASSLDRGLAGARAASVGTVRSGGNPGKGW